MSDRLAYRITERDTELIRITEDWTIQRILERVSAPPEPPEWLREIIRVRRSVGDPVTGDFIIIEELPPEAPLNTAFTTGDGQYWFHNGVEWRRYVMKFSDLYIRMLIEERGRLNAAVRLIDDLIARIDPADYLTSGDAGAQSVSFPSLAELMEFYKRLRDLLMEEEAAELGMNSGLMLETKRRPVGGVVEDYEQT